MELWPFTPNWAVPVSETLDFLTDVQTSESGAETRTALRLAPRRIFESRIVAQAREHALFDIFVHGRGGAEFALPIFPDVQLLFEPVLSGAEFINCRTAGFEFVGGGAAALFGETALDSELLQVASITDAGIVLQAPVQRDWPLGVRLYPCRAARLAQLPEMTRRTDSLLEATVEIRIVDPCDVTPAAPALFYRGAPVFTDTPDESTDLTHSYTRMLQVLDNDTGVPYVADVAGGFFVREHFWTIEGREKQVALRRFMYWLRGRQRACWLPTHSADFNPVATAGNTLTVQRCGYAAHAALAPGRRDLRIELADGSAVHRRITAVSQVDDTERLVLDGPAPDSGTITRISFMALARLYSDAVVLEHQTDADGTVRARVQWRSVRDDLEAIP